MAAIRSENMSLFVRDDEKLEDFKPSFSRWELVQISTITVEAYSIFGDINGHGGIRYYVTLPQCGLTASICRTGENATFYGNSVELINEYIKDNPEDPATAWLLANATELNTARHYWDAVNSLEIAELARLQANLSVCTANAYAAGKPGLSIEEKNMLIVEFGYDPDQTYGV